MADNQQQYWLFEVFGTDPDTIGFFGNAGIIIPSGSTAQRPPPVEGHLRLNTDSNVFEGFFDGLWQDIGTGGGGGGTFIGLSDTPGVYAGTGNRVLKVGAAETGIEFSPNLEIEPSGRLRVPGGYEALVDADTVLPNKKYVDDRDNLQLSLSGGLMTGGITMGTNAIVGLPITPTSADEAASKAYVDQIASGIDFKESVHMGTTGNLPATYDNGTAGLGATLTATTPGVLPPTLTDDHAHYVVGTRILVKEQTDQIENGIFEITDTGSGEEVSEIITVGDSGDSLDGTYWTFNDGTTAFYVWYDTPAGGGDPAPGGTGIMVSISTNSTAETVKDATILAVTGSAALAAAFDDETDTFFLVNDNTGTATDSGVGTSGFTVSTTIQGTGTPTAWILTRTTDADNSPTNEVSGGMFAFIEDGATLANTGWVLAEPEGQADLGTDDLVFTVISGAGGAFLPLAGGTMTGSIVMGAPGIQTLGDVASPTAPAFSFFPDPGTGIHQVLGPGTVSVVIGTAPIWDFAVAALLPSVTLTNDIGSAGLKISDFYGDHHRMNFGAAADPSYSFEGDTDTGMYNGGGDVIKFSVGSSDALTIESDGTISVDTASYETLVLSDNDVPNKKYVDDSITAITAVVDIDLDTRIEVEEGADDDTIRMDVGDTPVGYGAVTDILLLNAAGLAVNMGTATGSGVVGAPINLLAGDGGIEGGVGGAVAITGGVGTTTGDGGAISLTTGKGGNTADGGDISLLGGEGGLTSGAGGNISLTGGAADGGGAGGAVAITAGAGASAGGDVTITGGSSTGVDEGGDVNINAGATGASAGGGDVTLNASAGGATTGTGGTVNLNAGAASAGNNNGGNINLNTARGWGTGDGGSIFLNAGFAGSQSGAAGGSILMDAGFGNRLGVGGNIRISGGTGGSSDGVAGGFIRIEGGNAGDDNGGAAVNWSGGEVRLRGAGGVGTGTSGAVILEPLTGTTAGVDTAPTQLRFQEEIISGTNYVGFVAPSAIGSNVIWTLPTTDSSGTQALVSDGSGTLSWSDTGGIAIVDDDGDTQIQVEESADEDIIRFDTGDTPAGYGAIANIMTLGSDAWIVSMGIATGSTTPGAPIALSAGIGGTEAGGDGGDISLNSGTAGTGSAGTGGDIILNLGSGDGAGVDGSVIMQLAGATFMTFAAGSGTITTPDGVHRDFDVTAGNATTVTDPGGILSLTSGVGGTSAGGDGGAVVITAGDAGAGSAGDGGDIELRPGALDGAGADGIVSVIGPSAGAGEIRLEDDAGGQFIGLQAAAVIPSSFTLTLPTADAAGTLVSDGSGNLSFTAAIIGGSLVDADSDTRVQVEESADDDTIRWDVGDTPSGYGAVPDIMTMASSGWTVAMGTAFNAATSGAPIILGAGTGNTTGTGGSVNLTAGPGGTLGGGGGITLTAGIAPATGTADGGDLNFQAGSANNAGVGGEISLSAGGGQTGGDITLTAGTGSGSGGAAGFVNISAGDALFSGAAGGAVTLNAGDGSGTGGAVNLIAGRVRTGSLSTVGGGAVNISTQDSLGDAGNVVVTAGNTLDASSGNGGDLLFTAGDSKTTNDGGIITLSAGDNLGSGSGGAVIVTAGNSGAAVGANAGGAVAITAGIGISSGAPGGAVTVTGGSQTSAGTAGGGSIALNGGTTTGDGGSVAILSGADNSGFDTGSTTGAVTVATANASQSGNGGAISITGGNAATTGFGSFAGGPISLTAGNSVGATTGGAVTVTAGTGGATGSGGALTVSAGDGGATSGVGGQVNINGGDAQLGNSNGGDIRLTGGNSTGSAIAGDIFIDGGDALGTSGAGGTFNFTTGNGGSLSGQPGAFNIGTGTGFGATNGGTLNLSTSASGGTGNGGVINVTSGKGGTGGDGGAINVNAGSGNGAGVGGAITINAGNGDAAAGTGIGGAAILRGGNGGGTSGDGGDASLIGGNADGSGAGGDANVTAGAGASIGGAVNITSGGSTGTDPGGAVNITAGVGGTGAGGDGGVVVVTAGSAGTASAGDGGDIELRPGALDGGGTDGTVRIIGPSPGVGILRLEDAAGGQFIGLQAAAIISSSFTLTLPDADATVANQALVSDAAGTLSFASAGSLAGGRFTLAFDDGDLTAGVLTVTHSLGTKFNHVTVYNNSDMVIIPTGVTAVSTTGATVDLSGAQTAEGGAIPGTWNVVVSA